jgi:hypothetical protein
LPKKKAVKTVHSETEEDSDKEDDADQNVDADYDDDVDMHESDSDLELLINRPTKPPIKTPVRPAFFYVMRSENRRKPLWATSWTYQKRRKTTKTRLAVCS